jgi:DNA-binding NarL/FixJ family response regulator
MAEELLDKFGCQVVGVARNAIDAFQMVRRAVVDVAVINLKFQAEVYPLADALTAANVPFVFATRSGASQIDRRFAHVPVVGEPFEEGELRGALLEAIDNRA